MPLKVIRCFLILLLVLNDQADILFGLLHNLCFNHMSLMKCTFEGIGEDFVILYFSYPLHDFS
jgi:hypothetical protein